MAITKLTIVTDSREQQPILFPSKMEWTDMRMRRHVLELNNETKALNAGDYCIEGYEAITAIERKGSIEEIKNNLIGKDRRRAMAALSRFQKSCKYPYLFVDDSLSSFNRRTKYVHFPDMIQDFLYRELHARNIRLLWLPSQMSVGGRRLIGETLVRIMWAHIVMETMVE